MKPRKTHTPPAAVILGIETSTPGGGVALADVEGNLLAHRWAVAPTGYSRRLMKLIDDILREGGIAKSQIAAVAVTRGPGSFTGVRVGLVTAKTLAQALGVPLYLESTLEMLAARIPRPDAAICAILDARRSEIYSAIFRFDAKGRATKLREEKVEPPEGLLADLPRLGVSELRLTGDATLLGENPEATTGLRIHRAAPPWNRPAADIVALRGAAAFAEGRPGTPPMEAAPEYLRLSDAERALARSGGEQ